MLVNTCYLIVLISTSFLDTVHSEIILPSTVTSSPRKACSIPQFHDYYYLSLEGDKLDPRKCYDGSGQFAVEVYCEDATKVIENDNFAICFDGQWYPSRHTCVQRRCKPVYDTYSTYHNCTTTEGVEVSCRVPAAPGTKVTIRCAHWRFRFIQYKKEVFERFCQKSGEWQTLEECEATSCSPVPENNSFYPWNAFIYRYKDGEWNQACVGTILDNFLIITAEQCLSDINSIEDLNTVSIAVGNHSMNHSDYNPAQLYGIREFEVYPEHLLSMIAVSRYIEFSDTVGRVCRTPFSVRELDEKVGNILSWSEDGKQTELQMMYTQIEKCRAVMDDISEQFPSNGPYLCSLNNNHTFRNSEIGGGFVMFHNPDGFLGAVLIDLMDDGRIPIFLDIGFELIKYTIDKFEKDFLEDNKEDLLWVIRRRGEY